MVGTMNRLVSLRTFVKLFPVRHNSTRSMKSVFFQKSVQEELEYLTGLNYERIFRVPRRGEDLPNPTYRFVTDEQLEKMRLDARKLARHKLQMPPVMDERQPVNEVLDEDEALKGYDSIPIVFTDITYGVHDRDRTIVVREPNGVLRKAEWGERDRMNLIYFPKEGRKMDVPSMFEEENLQEIMGPEKYEYILDRNCVQFEPDHPVFIRTANAVFEHVNQNGNYDALFSTRHYGPMVFYLVWEKKCDDLMAYYFQSADLNKALSVIKLFSQIHPDSGTAKCFSEKQDLDLLRMYISEDSLKSSKLHVALEGALEKIERVNNLSEQLKKAHGSDD